MKTQSQAVRLSNANTDDSTLVKSCALFFFRALRTVGDAIAEIPDVATKAASDIAEAWEESSRPNA
jgi:hypothetical protein